MRANKIINFTVRLEENFIKEIEALREKYETETGFDINRSQMVRRIIIQGLKDFKEGKVSISPTK